MSNTSKKIVSIIGIAIGVIIIIIGFSLQYTSNYSIGASIKFGADFYTEMYDVTKDVGRAINYAINDLIRAIGWLIISLGAIDICFFVYKLVKASEVSAIEVKAKVQTEEKLKCEVNGKNKRETEERLKRESIERNVDQKDENNTAGTLKLTQRGDGYICPTCGTANYSFSPCKKCCYFPMETSEIKNEHSETEYSDISCPNCGELISVLDEKNLVCPWCNVNIDLS